MTLADVVAVACVGALLHAWGGYSLLVRALARRRVARYPDARTPAPDARAGAPNVTVVLTVHNEERVIERRLRNLLDSDFDPARLQLLVCSDGSDDATDARVAAIADRNPVVELIASGERLGKTGTQNLAIGQARGDILVFTDADTLFAPDCLSALVAPFDDLHVGGTTGALQFASIDGSAISSNQSRYWTQELAVRSAESRLGWLCVATGACMAVRHDLYRPPEPDHGDDCVLPLDVVLAGRRFVHVDDALAFDSMPADARGELRARIRMTQRNWTGTLSRRALFHPIRYPGYGFALVSHKLLKWLTPFLLVTLAGVALVGANDNALLAGIAVILSLGALGALAGSMLERRGRSVPVLRTLYAFGVLNIGFAIGGWQALIGRRTISYDNGRPPMDGRPDGSGAAS